MELAFPQSAPDAAMFAAATQALASVLDLPVSANRPDHATFPGVKIDLGDPAVARRKFLGMITLSERFALRRPRR